MVGVGTVTETGMWKWGLIFAFALAGVLLMMCPSEQGEQPSIQTIFSATREVPTIEAPDDLTGFPGVSGRIFISREAETTVFLSGDWEQDSDHRIRVQLAANPTSDCSDVEELDWAFADTDSATIEGDGPQTLRIFQIWSCLRLTSVDSYTPNIAGSGDGISSGELRVRVIGYTQ